MKNFILLISMLVSLGFSACAQSEIDPAKEKELTKGELATFQKWVAVGPGGLPHTLAGFRTLQALNARLKDPLDTRIIATRISLGNDVSTLEILPPRQGERPTIAPFAIPHRQTDQHNSSVVREAQRSSIDEIVSQNKGTVHYLKSYFEKHNDALFLIDSASGNPDVVKVTHGEIGHMHPTDGSMHATLSPSDAKEVIEKGWGELHGLYGQVFQGNDALSGTYMMIYSPRNEQELKITNQIINAAIMYNRNNILSAKPN